MKFAVMMLRLPAQHCRFRALINLQDSKFKYYIHFSAWKESCDVSEACPNGVDKI
jgi:hypothetical protein